MLFSDFKAESGRCGRCSCCLCWLLLCADYNYLGNYWVCVVSSVPKGPSGKRPSFGY